MDTTETSPVAAEVVDSKTAASVPVAPYERRLNADQGWALSEGSRFFDRKSEVHQALRKIARALDDLGIPYAVSGGMALFLHGFHRFTEDVDILVTRAGLDAIHEKLDGLGYIPPFRGSKNLRDTEFGVRVEFLVTGGYPGDGLPKPVSFPDPENVQVESDGVKYLKLPTLVELKLASGMSLPDRMKDLADVIELIKLLNLGRDFADQVDPYVRPKFEELWDSVFQKKKKYLSTILNAVLPHDPSTFDELTQMLRSALEKLEEMHHNGVELVPNPHSKLEPAYLMTTDPEVARKYDMHPEVEFLKSK